jgi:ferredoxin, 2Fe-2S
VTTVRFHLAGGDTAEVEVMAGETLMVVGAHYKLGIIGTCGGQAMCATCHVYIRPEFIQLLPQMSDDEDATLDGTAAPRDPARSRLSCQLRAHESLELLEVDVPSRQI